jgi:GNAT superfamily N-acetyltransferase
MDMLIKLFASSGTPAAWTAPVPTDISISKPIGPEFLAVEQWVAAHMPAPWLSEARVALANRPITLFIAKLGTELLGFSCYDATARGFVGPIGVLESARGKGIGAALLLACLHDMRSAGYGYAIAGYVGAPEFFRRVAGAVEIPDSTPGLYANMLRS